MTRIPSLRPAMSFEEARDAAPQDAGVAGSLGAAPYPFSAGFPGAWEAADAAMYADKRRRRAAA